MDNILFNKENHINFILKESNDRESIQYVLIIIN